MFLSRVSKYLFAILMVSVLFQSVAIIVIHYSERPPETPGGAIAARFDNEHLHGSALPDQPAGNIVRSAGARGADRIREEAYVIRSEADRFRGDAEAPAAARIRRQTERRIEDVLRSGSRATAASPAPAGIDPLDAAIRGGTVSNVTRSAAPVRPAVLNAVADLDSLLRIRVAVDAARESSVADRVAAPALPAPIDHDATSAAGLPPLPAGVFSSRIPAATAANDGAAASREPAVDPLRGLLASASTATDAPAPKPRRADREPVCYEVKPGDSIERIARRTGVSAAELRRINGLDRNALIHPGQQLLVEETSDNWFAGKAQKKTGESDRVAPVALSAPARVENRREEAVPADRGATRDRPSSRMRDSERDRDTEKRRGDDDDLGRVVKRSSSDRRAFAWPLRGRISSAYGMRVHPVSFKWDMHTGIDIAANTGEPIRAAMPGTVTFAGWMGGYGKIVVIQHANGYETRYAHCSKLLVKRGDRVAEGKQIARVGSTGTSTGPHLHFEVLKNGRTQNPSYHLK